MKLVELWKKIVWHGARPMLHLELSKLKLVWRRKSMLLI
ncbi:hypothetical protein A2U01_0119638, partial [Trifolium medium]|nr:hypothetical protein [Trifolium medium]